LVTIIVIPISRLNVVFDYIGYSLSIVMTKYIASRENKSVTGVRIVNNAIVGLLWNFGFLRDD
jgi:hypothetical protein